MAESPYLTSLQHLDLSENKIGAVGVLALAKSCLLYTSDAADERSSVDLGGRRIIKKKKNRKKKKKKTQQKKKTTYIVIYRHIIDYSVAVRHTTPTKSNKAHNQ